MARRLLEARHIRWDSPNTGREMSLLTFGDRGVPLIYLPTSAGDALEFQCYGLDEDCQPWLTAGLIRVISVDARGPHTLFDPALPTVERMPAYARTERYVADEVLPWVAKLTGHGRAIIVGASYGAFMAANLLFKYPRKVDVACGLGGVYQMWHRLDGHHDDTVYHHTPLDYVPGIDRSRRLDEIRATRGLVIFAAEDDAWLDTSIQMRDALVERELPHACEVWPSPANHHEHWWKKQMRAFLERYVGQPD